MTGGDYGDTSGPICSYGIGNCDGVPKVTRYRSA